MRCWQLRPSAAAVVPAAGSGVRLGANVPKAFVTLGDRAMVQHCVAGLRASGSIDDIVVVVSAEYVEQARSLVGQDACVVVGGAERTDSVRAGLRAVGSAEWVLVHDAARPLTPPALVARVVAELQHGVGAVIPVLPVVDTVKSVDVRGMVVATPDRSSLRAVQTPQGFSVQLLRSAYEAAGDIATDDAALVERLGEPVRAIEGDRLAFKITTSLDLMLAEAILEKGRIDG